MAANNRLGMQFLGTAHAARSFAKNLRCQGTLDNTVISQTDWIGKIPKKQRQSTGSPTRLATLSASNHTGTSNKVEVGSARKGGEGTPSPDRAVQPATKGRAERGLKNLFWLKTFFLEKQEHGKNYGPEYGHDEPGRVTQRFRQANSAEILPGVDRGGEKRVEFGKEGCSRYHA